MIENGGATGVEYVQDGEKRIAKLAVGGEVTWDKNLGRGRDEACVPDKQLRYEACVCT